MHFVWVTVLDVHRTHHVLINQLIIRYAIIHE